MFIRRIVSIAAVLVLAAVPSGAAPEWRSSAQPAPPPIQVQKNNPRSGIKPTSVTISVNRVTSQTGPNIVNLSTTDRLGVYSARPVLAVGDITSMDLARQTITVKIDRELSSLPHVLTARAQKKKVQRDLLDRMFPAERTFVIRRATTLMDETRVTTGSRAAAMTPRERFNSKLLKLRDFHLGDRVSVRFRYYENEAQPAGVFNVSRVSRDRRDFEADYRMVPVLHRNLDNIQPTTHTLDNGQVTTTVLPAGVFVPPQVPRGRLMPPRPQ